MDILDKITKLREKRHWTEYQLAERSGLTQSTISSWYRKDMLPSITSLSKICDAFDITISQFFFDDENSNKILNTKQQQLIEYASKLSPEQYDALLLFLREL